jgi:hypothetical protein
MLPKKLVAIGDQVLAPVLRGCPPRIYGELNKQASHFGSVQVYAKARRLVVNDDALLGWVPWAVLIRFRKDDPETAAGKPLAVG